MEKVYIVVPVYNAKKYIKAAVKSILKQSYTNIQLVLVDDGSTDGSGAICDAFAKKDPRVQVIHKKNGGCVAARKDGVAACGDEGYITYCDADDTLPKDAIKLLIEGADSCDLCVGRIGKVWRNFHFKAENTGNYKLSHEEFMDKKYCSWFGITDVPVSLFAKLYKAPVLKKALTEVPDIIKFMGEDQVVTLHVMPLAKSLSFIGDTVYHYRPCGGTRKHVKTLFEDWRALYLHRKELIKENNLPAWYQRTMDVEFCNMAFSCFANYLRKPDADDEGLRAEIKRICATNEVKSAAQNPDIEAEKFIRVQLLREDAQDKIFEYVKKSAAQNPIKALIKKLAVKYA